MTLLFYYYFFLDILVLYARHESSIEVGIYHKLRLDLIEISN